VLGDLIVVTGVAQVSALAVDDLERDTASFGGDDGYTGMEGLRNLDLETFTSGELKSDVGVIQESVQDCNDVIRMTSWVSKRVNSRWSLGGILITMISLEYSSYLVAIR